MVFPILIWKTPYFLNYFPLFKNSQLSHQTCRSMIVKCEAGCHWVAQLGREQMGQNLAEGGSSFWSKAVLSKCEVLVTTIEAKIRSQGS